MGQKTAFPAGRSQLVPISGVSEFTNALTEDESEASVGFEEDPDCLRLDGSVFAGANKGPVSEGFGREIEDGEGQFWRRKSEHRMSVAHKVYGRCGVACRSGRGQAAPELRPLRAIAGWDLG